PLRPIDGPAVPRSPASPTGFQILQARFGTEGSWADVTDEVRKLVRGNKLTISLGETAIKDRWPDPAAGKAKILILAYLADGRVARRPGRSRNPGGLLPRRPRGDAGAVEGRHGGRQQPVELQGRPAAGRNGVVGRRPGVHQEVERADQGERVCLSPADGRGVG